MNLNGSLKDLFWFFVFLLVLESSKQYDSPKHCYQGRNSAGNFYALEKLANDTIGTPLAADATIIVKDDGSGSKTGNVSGSKSYTIDCCGEIDTWEYDNRQATSSCVLTLMIWREIAANRYRLIASDPFTVPPASDATYHWPKRGVKPSHTIEVKIGDYLGFRGNCLEYIASTSYDQDLSGTVVGINGLNPVVGSDYNIPSEIPEAVNNVRPDMIGFPFGANMKPGGTNPTCNLNLVLTEVSDNVAVGTILGTVVPVGTTNDFYMSLPNAGGMKGLSTNENTGLINVTLTISVKPPGVKYTLTGRVTDRLCFTFGECKAEIEVKWSNKPITLDTSNDKGTLSESTSKPTALHPIVTNDDNRLEGEDFNPTCSVTKVTPPNGGGFSIATVPFVTTKFTLQYDGNPPLSSQNSPVVVEYECKDQYGTTSTGTYTLSVTPNKVPYVTDPVDKVKGCVVRNVSALSIKKNDVVFHVNTKDDEGDTILSSLTKKNASSPFAWDSGKLSIYATQDLRTLLKAEHDFTLELWDKWNLNNHSKTELCLLVTDINSLPEMANCPRTEVISENSADGTLITQINVVDSNKDRDKQTFTFSMTVTPTQFTSSFTLDRATGEIRIVANSNANDYETYFAATNGGCIDIVVRVSDGVHYAAKDCNLCVKIKDVNDPPRFNNALQVTSIKEGTAVPNTLNVDLNFTDPDIGDTHTLKIISGNPDSKFSIDPITKKLKLDKPLDAETDPKQFNLVVQVEDKGGLIHTIPVTINLEDINDHSPTFGAFVCAIELNSTVSLSTVVAQVTATDGDSSSSPNGQIVYSIKGIGFGKTYFWVDPSSGEIRLRRRMDLPGGTEFYVTVFATDKGTPSNEGSVHCKITVPVIPTTTESNDREQPCFFCTEGGVTLFTLFMLALGMILVALLYLLFRYLCPNALSRMFAGMRRCCRPRKPWQAMPRKEPQPPQKPEKPRYDKPRKEPQRPQNPDSKPERPKPEKPEKPKKPKTPNTDMRIIAHPRTPIQNPRFNFWNQGDTEVRGKNPAPSNTHMPF